MCKSVLMAMVEPTHELLEVVSSDMFLKSSRDGDEVEEFSTKGQLEDDVADLLALA